MPEIDKEETQEEFGWEDLTAHDDGTRDMGEPTEEPTETEPESGSEEQPEETAPVETPAAAEPTEQAEAATEETTEEQEFTLPGGKKVKLSELTGDPKLLGDLVTQSNQYSLAQRQAEERKAQVAQLEAEKRQLLDQYTQWEMQQRLAAEQFQQQQAPPPQRPASQVLTGAYAPVLERLVQEGRVTEDQKEEFGNVIAEYMFDQQNIHNLIQNVVAAGVQRINYLENQLNSEVVPDVVRRQQADAVYWDQQVQNQVASIPGYEPLADPEEWNRLKLFIQDHVNASPRDYEGRPTFDPNFDAPSMAQMYDAMTGGDMRASLMALKQAKEEEDKKQAAMVGGETSAKASAPPKQRQPSKMTPEEEAMDFSDPTMATG